MITLEWLKALHERHPNALHFGLMHVCFHNKRQLGQAYGARDATKMLSDLPAMLRQSYPRPT